MRTWIPVLGLSLLLSPAFLSAQDRDVRGERLVLDDNGAGGTANTMTIRTDPALATNVVLTIPDPGAAAAQFLLAPPGTSGAWFLGGNAGTVFGTDLLGTSDATALQIGVNGGANNSLILNTSWRLQRDNGGDTRGFASVDLQSSRILSTQVASGAFSFIGAGGNNTVSGNQSFIGAGLANTVTSLSSAVIAGYQNIVENFDGFIGAGQSNTVSSSDAGIVSGSNNTLAATATNGFIGAGNNNTVSGANSVIGGGILNQNSGFESVIGGGRQNVIQATRSAIPGGSGLTLSSTAQGTFGFLADLAGSNNMTIADQQVAVFGNTDLWIANNDNTAGELRLYEANASTGAFPAGTNYTAFVAGTQGADITYTLPPAQGGAGQVLQNDGTGTLTWAAAGMGGLVFNRVTTSGPTYNAASTDGIIGVDVTGGPVTINLPAANTLASGCIMIVNVEAGNAGTNNVTINAAAGDTFDGTGATSLTITFGQGQFKFYSDGANGWFTY